MTTMVSRKRRAAASAFVGLGFAAACTALRRRFSDGVTILAYHRVVDVPDEDAWPFDIELVSASAAGFREQMAHLRRHFVPLTIGQVFGRLAKGEPLPRGAAVVTFDDGFDDNYHVAFPVLRELGIPATIFVSTGYLDSGETFWFDQLAHQILTASADSVEVELLGRVALGTGTPARRAALRGVLRRLKQLPESGRLAVLDSFTRALAAGRPLRDPCSRPLTWDQAREMSRGGIEFGSHSVSHPILSRVDEAQLEHEVATSRRRIEEETGQPVTSIAYPVGGPGAFTPGVLERVRASGYVAGVSYMAGVQSPRQWDPFALRRIPVERYVGTALFRASLALPRVFGS